MSLAMVDEKPENPVPQESHRIVIPNEIVTPRSSKEIKNWRLQRRCKLCCVCWSTVILIVGLILMILFLTVIKVKKPKIKLKNLTIVGLDGVDPFSLVPSINLTAVADLSVKNPNIASFKFNNGTTEIYYKEVQVVDAQILAGNAKARRTIRVNVTMDFMLEKILGVPGLGGDLTAGSMPLNTRTGITGKVKIIGAIKKTVAVKLNCSLIFIIANQTVQDQNCDTSVDL